MSCGKVVLIGAINMREKGAELYGMFPIYIGDGDFGRIFSYNNKFLEQFIVNHQEI